MKTNRRHSLSAQHDVAAGPRRAPLLSTTTMPVVPAGSADIQIEQGRQLPALAPILVPADVGFAALGIGRTKGYELIKRGDLIARKVGSRTLIETESIRRLAARLPRAGGAS